MLRKSRLLAAVSLALTLCAQTIRAQESQTIPIPTITVEDCFADDKYDAQKARTLLADAAKNQDLDIPAALLDAAERNQRLVGADLDVYALAYYEATVDAAEKTQKGLEAFAETFRVKARESVGGTTVAARICRSLARYDVELAKKLFYQIVDDLARSDEPERQEYAKSLSKGIDLVRPLAPSDAKPDDDLKVVPDDLDEPSLRSLAVRVDLALNAYHAVIERRDYSDVEKLYEVRRQLDETALERNPRFDSFNDVMSSLNRAQDSESIQKVRLAVKEQNPNVYLQSKEALVTRCVSSMIYEARSADDLDAAIREVAKRCAEEINDADGNLQLAIMSRIGVTLPYLVDNAAPDAAPLVAFAEEYRKTLNPSAAQYADAIDGMIRFRSLVGQEPIVEGICTDGSEYSIKNDHGKAVYVVFSAPHTNFVDEQALDALKRYPDKFAVVEYRSEMDAPLNSQAPERKIISRVRSNADKELGGKEFVDLAVQYGFVYGGGLGGRMLVAPDGRVVALGVARPINLDQELQKIFNEN